MAKLLICAGGTGGGVYPALTVLQALSEQFETLWVGSIGGIEADLVMRKGIKFEAIPAAGVHGVSLRALPGNLTRLWKGALAARKILESFHPDVMFFTGGYLAVPMALAGTRWFGRSTPSVLFAPDIEPGLALKTLARFASQIGIPAEEARRYFPRQGRVTVTGYPVRPELLRWSRKDALEALNLRDDLPTLLVTGGSTGAQSINQAVIASLPVLLEEVQLVHLCGQRNWSEVQAAVEGLQPELAARYHPYAYLHEEMGAALRSADLVVSRAGASILGEYPLFGLPAIVVPYPYAWRYQQVNAEFLSTRGAAVILPDTELATRLASTVVNVLQDQQKLANMRKAMQSLARPDAANKIAELISSLALKERSFS